MRLKLLIGFALLCYISAQAQNFDDFLIKGKNEFKNAQFAEAAKTLKKAIALDPNNPEAHYFLGYCYSRLNASDANTIPNTSLTLTLLSSEEFETVNRLTPKYTGEFVVLDPYSKITAEWGSAAFKYLVNHQKDSAIWAFKQGKARGGFGDFFMNYNRMNMQNCRKNAFLFLSGDNYTFYCLYLQLVDQFRTDIKAVDVTMLGTIWYPQLIREWFNIEFDMSNIEVDSCHYQEWKDSSININHLTWTIPASYEEEYILRSELLLLSLLKKNQLRDDLNFIAGFPDEDGINLFSVCEQYLCLERFIGYTPQAEKERVSSLILPPVIAWDTIMHGFSKYLNLSDFINPNSKMEVLNFESIQIRTLAFVNQTHTEGDINNARMLMVMFNKHRKHYRQAFSHEEVQNYYNALNELFVKR